MTTINLKQKPALINVFFGGWDTDCLENVKNIIEKANQAYVCILDGMLSVDGCATGIRTDYFDDAWVLSSTRYKDGEREVYVERNKDGKRGKIFSYTMGKEYDDILPLTSDNNYDIDLDDERRGYRMVILNEDETDEEWSVWFEDQDKAIICNF